MDNSKKTINIEYLPASYNRRIMANFLDFLIFVVILVFSFIGCRAIVQSTPYYQQTDALIYETKKDSHLYKEIRDGYLMDAVSFYTTSEEYSTLNKKIQLKLTITDFINYINNNVSESKALEVEEKYDEMRLSSNMTYENVPMFIYDETKGKVEENTPACKASNQYYIDKFYAPFIDEYCQGYLITLIPNYYEFTKYQTDMFLYAELLPSFIFSGLITYFVPIFIFKRGRKTFGKLIYKISVVDSKFLSPKLGRALARQSIYFFGEILLSVFTFAIPAIISFSMMAFSKKKQGFADYMLGLRDIDSGDQKVYFTLDEAMIEHLKSTEKHTDFSLGEND